MQKFFLILIVLILSFSSQKIKSQTFWASTLSESSTVPVTTYQLCASDCNASTTINNCIPNLNKRILDIAIDSDQNMYYTLDGFDSIELYKTNLNSADCKFLGNLPPNSLSNSLVCDSSGIVYSVGLYFDEYNPKTETFTRIGQLPINAGGDAFFYHGDLYYLTSFTEMYKINMSDPLSSTLYWSLGLTNNIFGAFSVFDHDTTNVYILANNSNSSTLIELNMEAKTIGPAICTYPFLVSGAAAFNNISCSSTTPVTITGFNYFISKGNVLLNWQTASEYDDLYFSIEKSDDGIDFDEIGEKSGSGNSNSLKTYSFIDNNPFINNYYRLKQVDKNGHFSYSKILFVKIPAGDGLSISQNYGSNTLNIRYNNDLLHIQEADIIDYLGRNIKRIMINNNLHDVDISTIPCGIYILHIITSNNKIINHRFIKN